MKKDIVILGGGAAGWLTALFLKKNYPNNNVTVIEDPATPPIIAGESGNALLNKLYNFLEINIDDWAVKVNAMPKLGGKFTDWNGHGTDFIHGLIPEWYKRNYESEFPEFARNNDFVACAIVNNVKLEDVFYNGRLQRTGKLPISDPVIPNTNFNVISMPMWHFDSRANADYLKTLGISRDINLVEGKYTTCTRLDSGGIASLSLEGDRTVTGDWFFDCSGFARLLVHKEMGEKFIDYTNYFPAREAVAWWDEEPSVVNYTALTAMEYGWSWGINLKHRVGNGYIFDPDLITVDQAIAEAEKKFGKPITPVANIKFTPNQIEKAWTENVFAFGLSSGFVEPLESNGLLVVVAQLNLLSDYWTPESSHKSIMHTKFNTEFLDRMNDVRDFLAMHYRGHRRDTEFWRSHANDKFRIPPSVQDRLDMFSEGYLGLPNTLSYGFESYATVAQGLGLINIEKLKARLLSKRSNILTDFDQHYAVLSKEIDQMCQICYTTEQWKNIIYGNS